jgi:CTP synthase (UTP-ammonia lyase)
MQTPTLIGLVGDYDPNVLAHRAIERCFEIARQPNSAPILAKWVSTESLAPGKEGPLKSFHALWCVPASPYRNTDGALWAIEYARTRSIPFLGSCGGCQHALLEFARHVLNLEDAGHTELDPNTPLPLLARLKCPLVEQSEKILITSAEFRMLYGDDSGLESYHCRYGLNPDHERAFAGTALEIVARSESGEPRAFRLRNHPFFIGTQFQPERRALGDVLHPIVATFFSMAESLR